MPEPKQTRKDAFISLLKEMSERSSYFRYTDIKVAAREQGLIQNEKTLKDYLGEAVVRGILHRAGKGWYSRLSEPAQLDPEPPADLIKEVETAFPLLDFSVWSTTQLNPWMHHLLAQPVHFLNAPADALETIGDTLRDAGWNAVVNPADSVASKSVRPGQKLVVLRPTLSRQPAPLGRQATIEHVLVDLIAETSRCGLMDSGEAREVVSRIIQSRLVQVSGMQRYADSRKICFLTESSTY